MELRNALSLVMAGLVIVCVTVAIAVVSWKAGNSSQEALIQSSENQLSSSLSLQKNNIEEYFREVRKQTLQLASQDNVIGALQTFSAGILGLPYEPSYKETLAQSQNQLRDFYENTYGGRFEEKNHASVNAEPLVGKLDDIARTLQQVYIADNPAPLGEKHHLASGKASTAYDVAHDYYHKDFKHFVETFGFYDFFLIDGRSNRVVYSVFKELDFATRLNQGPFSESGLGDAYKQASQLPKGQAILTDFSPYLPSYNDPAAFIATPVFQGENRLGVLVLQMPIDKINETMTVNQRWQEVGLGDTGEMYLVGADGLLRSESRALIEKPDRVYETLQRTSHPESRAIQVKQSTIGHLRGSEESVSGLLGKQSGIVRTQSYLGNEVMSAYMPLEIENLQWGIVGEIEMDEILASSRELFQSIINTAIGVGILVIAISAIYGRFLAGRISGHIRESVDVANEIAAGRLNVDIQYQAGSRKEVEQLKQALSQMACRLSDTVNRIKQSANTVDASVKDVSQGNVDLAKRTEEQAITLESTAKSIWELSDSATENARSASEVKELASSMSGTIKDTANAMHGVVETMSTIRNESGKIVEVIDLVDEISFQTNLLALNASVEAARAGDHGRGFAVVATEVRNLALRSSEAVRSIEALVTETNSRIDAGYKQVTAVGESNERVLESISKVIDEVQKIAGASEHQARELQTINDSMHEIDSMTQENASLVQQAAAAGVCLGDMAAQLNHETAYFQVEGALRKHGLRHAEPA